METILAKVEEYENLLQINNIKDGDMFTLPNNNASPDAR